MAAIAASGIFERFYQNLIQKSPLFETPEVKSLLGANGFNIQQFKAKIGAVIRIAKNILSTDPRITEKDLNAPIKYGNFVDDVLYQAEWLEATRLALQFGKNTYTGWLTQIGNSHHALWEVPLVFRTHELCVAILKKAWLPPVGWIPPELFQFHPDLYQYLC